MNARVLKQLKDLEKYHGVSVDELIERYTIKDEKVKDEISRIAEANNNTIHERDFNRFRVTPRHIQVTFDGKYRTKLGC